MWMVPREGSCSVASMRSVEVLPAPFGPTSAKMLPGSTAKPSSLTASRTPSYESETPSTLIIDR